MEFCDECGSAMVNVDNQWICRSCEPEKVDIEQSKEVNTPPSRSASVTDLPTTDSGAVRKKDAMQWLDSLDQPSPKELKSAILAKPSTFTGSTYPTSISNIRVTGDPQFIETVAGLFKPILELEGANTRVELNLQQTEDRDTGELTENFALYISVAERG